MLEGVIFDKVEKSIKDVKESCVDDFVSGECVVVWDEVEEFSVVVSYVRDKKKDFDFLDEYCKDNFEISECCIYD